MFPASFDESNCVLSAPPGVSAEDCAPLSAARSTTLDGTPIVVTCWKPTVDELKEIARTGRVWLVVWGKTMPPVALLGASPFSGARTGD